MINAPLTVATVLLGAANMIRTHGHCKSLLRDGDRHCALGAIVDFADLHADEAEDVDALKNAAIYEVQRRLPRSSIGSYATVAAWNDASSTTVDDVIRVLEETAGVA